MTYTPLQQNATPTLGTSGDAVKALQTHLNQMNAGQPGYTTLKVDGLYGPLTQAAAQKYKTTALANPPVVVDSSNAKSAVTDMNKGVQARDQVLGKIGYTSRMDYSDPNFPQGKSIPTDPTTGKDLYTSSTSTNTTQPVDYSSMSETDRRLKALDEELTNKATAADAEFKRLSAMVGQESPEEKAILDGIRQSYANAIVEQKRINTNVETGTTIRGIRDNTQQFANAVQQGNLIQAIDIGKNKVLELETKMNSAINEAKSKIRAGKLAEAKAAYDQYKDMTTERRTNLNNMADRATQLDTLNRNMANDALKARQEELKAIREEEKLSLDERRVRVMERNAATAANNAFSNPSALTAKDAKAAGLPESLVGVTDADIIGSFMSNTAPDWFKNSIYSIYPNQSSFSPEGIQSVWKEYLQKPEIKAYRNAYAAGTKGKSTGVNLDGSTGTKKANTSGDITFN